MKYFYISQLNPFSVKTAVFVLATAGLTLFQTSTSYGQCNISPCLASHTKTILVDTLLQCGMGTPITLFGDIQNNNAQNDCELDNTPPPPPTTSDSRCFEFIFLRTNPNITSIEFKFGKGAGCNGEVDAAFSLIDGVCTMIGTGGSGYPTQTVNFTSSNEIRIYICDNSAGQMTMCGTCRIMCTPPTISLGASPTVCQGATSASLPYSGTTGSPNQYTIDYNAAAEAQGFVDVAYTALPG
ncbi:MAG: hypothetical protein JNK89_05910, partial [Saprospiraceae bacterium]|nr:hypothetical protein [Saprospiraceae bacterium]